MAAAKKQNPKNPTVKPMPVGKPKPVKSVGARPSVGMTKPATVPGFIAPKPVAGPKVPQAKNLTPPSATGIKKQTVKKKATSRTSGLYW